MQSKERNINLDVFRIVCCIFVLCNHILSRYIYDQRYGVNYFMVFLGTLNRMAVPGFFMITGYFLFRNEKKYTYILKKSLKIFFPAFLIILFTQLLDPFLCDKNTFINTLLQFNINFSKTFICILKFSSDICKNTQFLTFVFDYIQLLLLYPIFSLICKDNDKCLKVRKYLVIYTLITQLLIPNICEFISGVSVNFPQLIMIKYIYVLLGYDIYLYFKKHSLKEIDNRKKIILFLIYLFSGIVQTILVYFKLKYYTYDPTSRFMTSEVFPVFFSTISLFLLFLSCNLSINSIKLKKIINFISKQTYGIYLVHWSVMTFIFSYKLSDIMLYKFGLISSFCIVYLCFLISLCITLIYKGIILLFKYIFSKIRR